MKSTIDKKTLSQSFEASDRIMFNRAKSFYQAFRLLPEERFKGVTALYAFNRYVDDLVDNDVQSYDKPTIIKRLNQLELTLQSFYAKEKNRDTYLDDFRTLDWWPSFEMTLKQFKIPLQPLLDQIDGQRMDLEGFQIDTLYDLIDYSSHVAGSVGIMMLPLLIDDAQNTTNPYLIEACLHLGIGMQLTNILRDVGEDYRERCRIYLPNKLMVKYNISRSTIGELSLFKGDNKKVIEKISPEFISLWEELNTLADNYYQSIFKFIGYFHTDAQFPLIAAAFSYRGITKAVSRSGYNCFTQRNYTSKLERVKLIAEAKQFLKEVKKNN